MKKRKHSDEMSADLGLKPSEPTLEQWEKLYEVAGMIKKLAPWNFLWDSNLVTIMLPGREEPVYCSVMGRLGECYAIGVYPDNEGLMSYYRLANQSADSVSAFVGLEQKCLACYYGDREEVSPKEREILKKLGLRFRGRNEWIYFRSMKPGFIPWSIDSEEADLLIQSLQNFVMAVKNLLEDKIKVDFEDGETLLRVYSPEKEMWFNTAEKMPSVSVVLPSLVVEDELLIARLRSKKRNTKRLEFEITYLPAPIQERKEDRPYLPRLMLLSDKKSGLPLKPHVAKHTEDIGKTVIEIVAEYIEKHGRPAAIYVRDEHAVGYLGDLCDKLEIKVIEGEGMPVSDMLLESMFNFMG